MRDHRTNAEVPNCRTAELREAEQSVATPPIVHIPAGSFFMGSDAGQECERPIHRVTVDAFGLAATQVTNRDYAEFLNATKRPAPPGWNHPNFAGPQQPVVSVAWFDAVNYCEWLTQAAGKHFRLPTEAEWE